MLDQDNNVYQISWSILITCLLDNLWIPGISGRSEMFKEKSGITLVFPSNTQWLGVWKLLRVKTLHKEHNI